MINVQFGAITSPTDMGAMRISGTGPSFVKLGQYVRYKVSTLQSFYRAMLVEYSSTAQCKLMQEERASDGSRHPTASDVVTATADGRGRSTCERVGDRPAWAGLNTGVGDLRSRVSLRSPARAPRRRLTDRSKGRTH
jgi:hypothetical protein